MPPTSMSSGLGRIAEYAGIPSYILPIGEMPYHSRVTHHKEMTTIGVEIFAGKGCDGMLFDMIGAMVKEGLLKASQPGTTLEGGEILF